MAEHTPTPWVQFAIDGKCDSIMPAGRDGDICAFRASPSDADAAFIVRAVNSHDALVKAAKAVVDRWETPVWKDAPATATYINALRAALSLSEQHVKTGGDQ